jgi:uncharacterized lipoprotein YddW (UPF0748 family)
MHNRILSIFFILVISSIPVLGKKKIKNLSITPKRELRAVWVATVANIDWPSKPGLSTEQQKKEIRDLLDMHKSSGMNAVIFQVRPASDAFYYSELEPMSKYLMGSQGEFPKPLYDPLEYFISETHKRGMEFHAWFNPYRIKLSVNDNLSPEHIFNKNPDWGWEYGNKMYFDPGNPNAREFVTTVVKDVVGRYDIDAVHFDDYFYPYQTEGKELPDSVTFQEYPRHFIVDDIDNWRRDNVNIIIMMLSQAIKETKPWVKFGISPFGVWRNKAQDPEGSDTNAGTTNYDNLYADVLLWQREGWIDYTMPQLYWRTGHPSVDYTTLAKWWGRHAYGRGMYIGHAAYKVDVKSKYPEWSEPGQLESQIRISREIRQIEGSAWYSSNHFNKELMGFKDSLKLNYYRIPSIIPQMQWIDSIAPESPKNLSIERVKKGKLIKWSAVESENEMDRGRFYVVYRQRMKKHDAGRSSEYIMTVTSETEYFRKRKFFNLFKRKYLYRVSALDRLYNESELSPSMLFKE